MGPESVLAFSLSILVICGNSGVYTNTVLARRNLHGDVRAPGPHLDLISENDNGPYQKEADPKVASIASVAADASLDVTKTMAKEISDAIALAVANAVAKIFAEQSAASEQDSEKLPENVPVASGSIKNDVNPNSNVEPDSKHVNIGYRRLSIKGPQEQPEVAYEVDDNESRPADNTRKFLKTLDADQSKISRRTFNENQTLASNQDEQINPTVNYRRNAIILHHWNNSGPSYQERINISRRYHQSINEQRDDGYD